MIEKYSNPKKIYSRVEKNLVSIVGAGDAKYILDILGRGNSFLKTICLLPHWLNICFNGKMKDRDLDILGEANLKAWISYTLYDYFRDGKIDTEKVNKIISTANIYTNEALLVFTQGRDVSVRNRINKLFKDVDMFYISLENKDFSKIDYLSFSKMVHKKSIAAATVSLLCIPENLYSLSYRNFLNFFRFYFTARQLSDDFDDFEKDMKLKIITPVTILARQKKSKVKVKKEIRLEIDKNFKCCIKELKKTKGFDAEKFIGLYVKPC